MKKLITLVTVAILGMTSVSFAQKYGHIDTEKLFTSMPGYEAASDEMKRYQEQKEKELNDIVTNFQKLRGDYETNKATMSPEKRAYEEEKLTNIQESAIKFEQNTKQRIQQKQADLMKPLNEQLKAAIKTVGKANKFTYIFDKATLLYFEGGTDVTELVLAELRKNAPKATTTPTTGQ